MRNRFVCKRPNQEGITLSYISVVRRGAVRVLVLDLDTNHRPAMHRPQKRADVLDEVPEPPPHLALERRVVGAVLDARHSAQPGGEASGLPITCSGQYLCQLGGFGPPFVDRYGPFFRVLVPVSFLNLGGKMGRTAIERGKNEQKMGEKWPKKGGVS